MTTTKTTMMSVKRVPESGDDVLAVEVDQQASGASCEQDKAKILARLRRMEGQVRGVQRTVEEDKYCVDVPTQISSVIAARAVGLLVLEDHIRGCVVNATDDDVMVTELTDAIERFTRSVG